jgi:metallophosphoesterase (TIGR03768 family)
MGLKKSFTREVNPFSKTEREITERRKGVTRRELLKYAAGTAALFSLISLSFLPGCGGGGGGVGVGGDPQTPSWPISSQVFTTAERQVLPVAIASGTPQINPAQVALYAQYGYSAWQTGPGLAHVKRTDLAPGYGGASNAARLLSFFTITDIHISDKESPAQVNYEGIKAGWGSGRSSAYSPVILSTPHVLDAAIQTVNALHQRSPIDFGISLGDDCNNTQYNELRWFIDVMDGQVITPSSGANLGAGTIDYQMPFRAAGLNRAIPWYQVIGNHDQFWMGSAAEYSKTLNAHVGSAVLNMAYDPNPNSTAVMGEGYYMGVVDGSTFYGDIIKAGAVTDFLTPPTVVADANRRSLSTGSNTTQNWIREFFNTASSPVGHGFSQANANSTDTTAACYSFVPKSNIPIKVIVLDDTVKGGPGYPSYAVGSLDAARLAWLQSELQAGQDNNQLMIIAAHVPVKPQTDINNTTPMVVFPYPNCTDDALLAILHNYPNLILWIAGHRHMNVVTPQPSPDASRPELGFWEVETASLRDFPQQFRTFDIRRNTDNTISIFATNVDTAVTGGSPAEKSRGYAIGASRVYLSYPLSDVTSHAYNAELIKQLTPAMRTVIANCGSPI